ncbi:MAG TPA: protein kinase [Ktedonobacterales bacterium]|jgi:serine/threonine protein kinase
MAEAKAPRLGGYELLERVGVGGMAEVYRARQRKAFGREVAVKIIKRGLTEDDLFRQRFLREAQATARLIHPHILPLIEFGQSGRDGELLFLVMPYVRGGTLRNLLDRTGGPLSFHQTAQLFAQLCDAVQYAHNQGLVHRDIKPSNVLLQNEQYILLSDFGIALDMEDIRLTSTGLGMGTAEYTAPEQAKGLADVRSDLYSLGIVLFEMLTGKVPFAGRTAFDILFQHATAPVQPIQRVNPALPDSLVGMDRVIQRVLAKDPGKRFKSAAELNAAVQAVFSRSAEPPASVAVSPEAPLQDTPGEAAKAGEDNGSTSSPGEHSWEEWATATPLPVPLAASAEAGRGGDRFAGRAPLERTDPAGERPTMFATPPSWRSRLPRSNFGERRPPSSLFQRFLLIVMALLALVLIGGAVYLGVLLIGVPGSNSALTIPSPAASSTIALSPTATIKPTRTPKPSPSATLSPTATPASSAQLAVTPPALTFTTTVAACSSNAPQKTLTIQNTGGGTLDWQASVQNAAYLSISPGSGSLGPSASATMIVTLICPSAPVSTTDTISFTSNGGSSAVVVTITVT